ncbi:hypothetical protein [Wolbachia endosymbiont of Ceratosolen solmsi]|nr:hypothetical protein [Wolbachia endosymbiont of Ceratosolen solmsi]
MVSIKVADLMLKHNVLDEITARLDSSVSYLNDSSPTSCRSGMTVVV